MPNLVVASVLRNEAKRWLPSVLKAWESFADIILCLDDGSTDETPDILRACSKVDYYRRDDTPMWGNEAPVRKLLWDLAVNSGADWIMIEDADMLPAKDPRPLMDSPVDAVAFRLYDLWSLQPPMYREDGFWQAHTSPRLWAFRNPHTVETAIWPARGIHCGHVPSNLNPARVMLAPPEYSLLHLAYSDADARATKAAQYRSKYHIMAPQEIAHANSIEDKLVKCNLLPFGVEWPLSRSV